MANWTTNLTSSVSDGIRDSFINTIGVGSPETFGYALIGGIIILMFLVWIFKSRVGFFGLLVVMPPLIYIVGTAGWIPVWLTGIVWISIGIMWAMIILRLFREA